VEYKKKLKQYYESNNIENSPDYFKLGWENANAQELRFEALTKTIDINGKRILDVGCGTGNLLEYLSSRYQGFKYTGVDILEQMVAAAKSKNLTGDFFSIDIFKNNPFAQRTFDIVLCSGIFNLNLGNNREFLLQAIKTFDFLASEVIAFNLLSDKSNDKEDTYFYFKSDDVERLLAEYFDGRMNIHIIEGYLQNDFTVVCRK
jgi:SAM-dependent methyltransferase